MRVLLKRYNGRLTAFLGSNAASAGFSPSGPFFLFSPGALAVLAVVTLLLVVIASAVAHPAGAHLTAPLFLPLAGTLSVSRVREMREARATLITSARAILDKAEAEKRELTAEEKITYDKHLADEGRQVEAITREERQLELDRSLAAAAIPAEARARAATETAKATGKPVDARAAALASPEYRSLYERYLLDGNEGLRSANETERRALEATGGPQGGFLQAPMEFMNELILFLKNLTFVRQRATVMPLATAKSMGAASLDNDPADADWTAEIATGGEDSTMSFGMRELVPHPSAKLIKISNKLMRVTAGRVETLVRDRLGYKFGVTEEKAFLTGSGVNQPLGVFTASASGINTDRDVSDGNTTTAVTFDGLINAKYSLKAQYQPKAAWAFSRTLVQNISKLKDGEGQYIWKLSVREGEPDRVLGLPFFMSEYVPNTFTTGKYVAVIGDWSFFWIADALTLEIQRLVELYAATNQTGFIGRMELDAQPVLSEAFARVKLA